MLILLLIDDDNQIIGAIYSEHYKKMLYTASNILGMERGEEAVHDIFVKFIKKYSGNYGDLRDKPAHFFVLSVRNHSIDILRKEDISKVPIYEAEFEIFTCESENPEQIVQGMDSKDRLIALIRNLNPVMREILEYKYLLDYSNKEIAELLGVSQSTVSSRIERARKALKQKLEKEAALNADE